MKNVKTLVSLILVLAMAVSLAACASAPAATPDSAFFRNGRFLFLHGSGI